MEQRDEQLESAARTLYEANANRVKPDWDQLGDATRSVWRGYVNLDPSWPFKYSIKVGIEALDRAAEIGKELYVSLHTSKPPEDLTTAVSGADYSRATAEAPLQTWPTATYERPLTLKEKIARRLKEELK